MDEIYSGEERRKDKRVKLKFTINVVYRKDEALDVRIRDGEKEYVATVLDMSEGGMSVLADVDIAVSTTLWVKFTLAHMEKQRVDFFGTMQLKGEVRNNKPTGTGFYRLGICFMNLAERDKRQIVDFMTLIDKKE